MAVNLMATQFDFAFAINLVFYYIVAKLPFLHPLLPQSTKDKLPTGWNFHMFWVAFSTGGTRIYNDYPSKMKDPDSFEPKVKVEPSYQLDATDIQSFYENGYIGPFDLMTPEEATSLKDHLLASVLTNSSKMWDFEFEEQTGLADILFPSDENDIEITEEFKKSVMPHIDKVNRHLDDERLLSVYRRPEIIERCAQLLGPDLLLWKTDCFEVPGHKAGTPWHQASLWLFHNMRECVVNPPNHEDLFQVTCWIALTDSNRERGCMRIIPGSHRNIYPTIVNRNFDEVDQIYRYDKGELEFPFAEAKEHFIETKAGQFFLFTERVIHGSVGNSTGEPRWGINGRIARPDTRFYTPTMFEQGHQFSYHKLRADLKNWRAVLLRGQDRYHYNRLYNGKSELTSVSN
jgi:chlorinating enzyme